jgi:secondary thiamine-phosphate synthase enzyme
MQIIQKTISLKSRGRGYHIITGEIENALPQLRKCSAGIAHILIKHTSAGLSINENADPTVRSDFDTFFDRLVPEDSSMYEHTAEGPDDMTSHIKSSLLGATLTVPVSGGRFDLGTWQGIYLCEFRNRPRSRNIVITIIGEFDGE